MMVIRGVLINAVLAVSAPLPQLQEIRSANGTLTATLEIDVARVVTDAVSFDSKLFNGLYPGPALRLSPGETMELLIVNGLSGDNPDPGMNQFRQPLTLSFHTHGLHVSPSGRSDNIYLEISPGTSQQHVIEIPADHAPGLHWYHAHHHGSTMLHVLNGLLGAIVIEDDDTVPTWLQSMQEQVVVMHYMNLGDLEDVHDEISSPIELNMDRSITSDEFYLCNGAYLPTINLVANEWIRLRFVHASHEASLLMEIVKQGAGGSACEMWLLATDGVALENPRSVSFLAFAPGSRRDIALRCDGDGSFELTGVEGAAGGGGGGGGGGQWFTGAIAKISVTNGGITADTDAMGDKVLWAASKPNYLSDLRGATPDQTFEVEFGDPEIPIGFVVATLVVGLFGCACLALSACAYKSSQVPEAPPSVEPGSGNEASAARPVFKGMRLPLLLGVVAVGVLFLASAVVWLILAVEVLPNFDGEAVNGKMYTGEVMVTMKVNQVQEWTLRGAAHPFHIHTNHFQLISHGSDDLWTVGDWYDTMPADGVIRFYTDRFTGTLVMHCHRLEHEDQGMMAKVVIAP